MLSLANFYLGENKKLRKIILTSVKDVMIGILQEHVLCPLLINTINDGI